VNIFAALC